MDTSKHAGVPVEDYEEIYLEPLFIPQCADEISWYEYGDRQWCQHDVWYSGDYDCVNSTRYIREDLVIRKDKLKGILESKGFVELLEELDLRQPR